MGKSKELATLTDASSVDIDGALSISNRLSVNHSSDAYSAFPSGDWAAKIYNQHDTYNEGGLVVANRYQAATSTPFLVGSLYDAGNGSGFDTYLKVDGSGRVTMPYQPAFNATAGSSTSLGLYWQKIDYSQQVTQTGGHYNATNYRFTAPVNGWYQFNASWSAENNSDIDGTFILALNNNLNANVGAVSMANTGPNYEGHAVSACAYLYANDYIEVWRYSTVNTTTRGFDWSGNFSGYLIG